MPIRYQIEEEVVVESIEVPTRALPGAQVEARVVIRSLGRSSGELRITDNGEVVVLRKTRMLRHATPGNIDATSDQPFRRTVDRWIMR